MNSYVPIQELLVSARAQLEHLRDEIIPAAVTKGELTNQDRAVAAAFQSDIMMLCDYLSGARKPVAPADFEMLKNALTPLQEIASPPILGTPKARTEWHTTSDPKQKKEADTLPYILPEDHDSWVIINTIRPYCSVIGSALAAIAKRIDWDEAAPERARNRKIKTAVKWIGSGVLAVSSTMFTTSEPPRLSASAIVDSGRHLHYFDIESELKANAQKGHEIARGGKGDNAFETTMDQDQWQLYVRLRAYMGSVLDMHADREIRQIQKDSLSDYLKELAQGRVPTKDYGGHDTSNAPPITITQVDEAWLSKPVGMALFNCLTEYRPKPGTRVALKIILSELPFSRKMHFQTGITESRRLEDLAQYGWKWSGGKVEVNRNLAKFIHTTIEQLDAHDRGEVKSAKR